MMTKLPRQTYALGGNGVESDEQRVQVRGTIASATATNTPATSLAFSPGSGLELLRRLQL